jgi:hypothetical protein
VATTSIPPDVSSDSRAAGRPLTAVSEEFEPVEPTTFWPDDWRGTLAIIFGIGTVTAVNILAAGVVLVAATSHDLRLVPLALMSFLVGLGLGALVVWLVHRMEVLPSEEPQ